MENAATSCEHTTSSHARPAPPDPAAGHARTPAQTPRSGRTSHPLTPRPRSSPAGKRRAGTFPEPPIRGRRMHPERRAHPASFTHPVKHTFDHQHSHAPKQLRTPSGELAAVCGGQRLVQEPCHFGQGEARQFGREAVENCEGALGAGRILRFHLPLPIPATSIAKVFLRVELCYTCEPDKFPSSHTLLPGSA
jgi:hypothetical protein